FRGGLGRHAARDCDLPVARRSYLMLTSLQSDGYGVNVIGTSCRGCSGSFVTITSVALAAVVTPGASATANRHSDLGAISSGVKQLLSPWLVTAKVNASGFAPPIVSESSDSV